jgi:anti-sigma regulatory factor (Ser/Thr protein kinase)
MERSLTLSPERASAAAARGLVRDVLSALSDEVRDVAVLLTSELVSNVVVHAETNVRVTVTDGPPVRVEVHDGVAATDAFRDIVERRAPMAPPTALGGRGVGLVHDLASRLGLTDDPDGGKVVWFELDPPPDGSASP